jgi:hypothetical protein
MPMLPTNADLELTVGPDEQVGRLDVPVDDAGRVNVLEPAQQLVREEYHIVERQGFALHELVQVDAHEFGDHVDFGEVDARMQDKVLETHDLRTKSEHVPSPIPQSREIPSSK